ncbi:MAG: COG2426 family protein [Bacillota bacterium]
MDWSAALKVLFVSAIPFLELRVGIPVGIVSGLQPSYSIALGILGNLLQVPLIMFIMHMLRRIAQEAPWAARWLARIDGVALKHQNRVHRYGWLGVALFIGIPIPGTGLWSGAALANLLGLPRLLTALAMGLGVAISGMLIGAVATGAITMIRLF